VWNKKTIFGAHNVNKASTMNISRLTLDVCGVAMKVGQFLKEERTHFRPERIEEKHAHDYVSYVDRTAEERIVTALTPLLPEAGFLTEEHTAVYHDEPFCWVIDPLDGTTNYIHDNAPYCVSIALRSRTELLLGVVYDPCRDECFYGWKDGGAYRDGIRLSVSDITQLDRSLIVTELPYDAARYGHTATHLLNSLYGKTGGIRMNGSAAITLCYIAAGRMEGWGEAYLGAWDYAAGALLVTEAGGTVTDLRGNADFFGKHHIIATNGHVHASLLDIFSEALPDNV
jgi:myo-inositol-1(or 4)-monophosphatase